MKFSKKYQRKIKKKILGCMSSIAICLMLIAGSRLTGLSMPISSLKDFSTKSTIDETKVINDINSQEGSVGIELASERK